MKVSIHFDPDDFGRHPARYKETIDLPALPSPGMEIEAPNGKPLLVRRIMLLRQPNQHGGVAEVIVAPAP